MEMKDLEAMVDGDDVDERAVTVMAATMGYIGAKPVKDPDERRRIIVRELLAMGAVAQALASVAMQAGVPASLVMRAQAFAPSLEPQVRAVPMEEQGRDGAPPEFVTSIIESLMEQGAAVGGAIKAAGGLSKLFEAEAARTTPDQCGCPGCVVRRVFVGLGINDPFPPPGADATGKHGPN